MHKEEYSLQELLGELRTGVEEMFPDRVWLRAEIGSVSARRNGHCYLELLQNEGGQTVAKARAVIWRSRYAMLSKYFGEATGGGELSAGLTVLVRVQVECSELYGLTLVIDDIDADVTLGEQERLRQMTIQRLRDEGLLDSQQGLELPPVPYALAVISARDAAGYGDFCHHLQDNEYGFRYRVDLYEATMQGATAPQSISDALTEAQSTAQYDAVLILRGGGSALDLACFDDYSLCRSIAQCRFPVFTAIGHDRDYHVADMVAHTYVKTPTALADVFLDCSMAEDERISSFSSRLRMAFLSKVSQMESRVELLSSRIHRADPREILSRGYTLAADSQGHVLKSASSIAVGDTIRLMFNDGTLLLSVQEVHSQKTQ